MTTEQAFKLINNHIEYLWLINDNGDYTSTIEALKTAIQVLQPFKIWHNLPDTADLLKDHYFYLVAHKDYKTPMKAKYHADGLSHFEILSAANSSVVWLYEFGDIVTHWTDLPDLPGKEGD